MIAAIKKMLDPSVKVLKRADKLADEVIALEPHMQQLTDEQLQNKTLEFKERIEKGESLDDLLVEAFAVVREASTRVLGMTPFKVQIIGGIALHGGNIAEMRTGEGKTLTSTMPAYLNALSGKGVHIITVNEYLASRDAREMGELYRWLGLTVGLNLVGMSSEEKKAQYACDIMYSTNNELGFDYLRDHMVLYAKQMCQRKLNYAIVDEVDSILIDEARTPLIISGGQKRTANLYVLADRFVKSLRDEEDYNIDIKTKNIQLNEGGIEKAERAFRIDNLYDIKHAVLLHHINNALKANFVMTRDVDYVVQDGEIVIVDQFTGRLMKGRAYSEGLHQAIQAKENVQIKQETSTLATITFQNLFRLYNKLSGMTGTAKTEEEEFRNIYNMMVVEVPTNRPIARIDAPDLVYKDVNAKFNAVVEEVVNRHKTGQPVLLGTVAVETSEYISQLLKRKGVPHNVLNAKNHEREAEIIMDAGKKGAVTIATNMAGRGTDIKLTDEIKALGGLAVIGTERHESRRIDNQLRGRSGRQGDPGFSRFYVSLEDSLMVRFGGDKLQKLFEKMGDEQIESKAVTKSITMAQKRVEGYNFDMRKQLLDYDDVLRRQREIIYAQRNRILEADEVHDMVRVVFEKTIEQTLQANLSDQKKQTIDVAGVVKSIEMMGMAEDKAIRANELEGKSYDEVKEYCVNKIWNEYEAEIKDVKRQFLPFEKTVVLRNIDRNWINHIDMMDKLRSGIYLRSYAQNNPLQQYVQEGFDMFEEMNQRIDREITFFLLKVRIRKEHAA